MAGRYRPWLLAMDCPLMDLRVNLRLQSPHQGVAQSSCLDHCRRTDEAQHLGWLVATMLDEEPLQQAPSRAQLVPSSWPRRPGPREQAELLAPTVHDRVLGPARALPRAEVP